MVNTRRGSAAERKEKKVKTVSVVVVAGVTPGRGQGGGPGIHSLAAFSRPGTGPLTRAPIYRRIIEK